MSAGPGLHTSKKGRIPDGAVLLTKDEAVEFQRRIIDNWKDEADVWPIKYSRTILCGATAMSSILINNHYRYKLRLQTFARMTTYMPVVVIPSILAVFLHDKVQREILVQTYGCPLCIELRASAFQAICSVAYPAVLAPISSFMMATRYFTYKDLPIVSQEPMKLFALWKKFTKPMVTTLLLVAGFQAFLASFLTYQENMSVLKVNQKLYARERGDDELEE